MFKNMHYLNRLCITLFVLCSQFSHASEIDKEVNHLIKLIAQSNTLFIRNGDKHTNNEAAEHLTMKYHKRVSVMPKQRMTL